MAEAKKPLRLSASAFKTWHDCPRKWWYERIDGRVGPPTESQHLGTRVHAAIERYLTRGSWGDDDGANAVARPGQAFLDDLRAFGGRSHIEARIALPAGHLGPLPFLGFADWCDDTPRVLDHKTTKDLFAPWLHTAESLAHDPQLCVYAGLLWEDERPPVVEIGHLYYQTKGARGFRPLLAKTDWQTIEDTLGAFREASAVMLEASTVEKAAEIPGNAGACGKYGGCPHAEYCPISGVKSEDSVSLLDLARGAAKAEAPPKVKAEGINPPDNAGSEQPTEAQMNEAAEFLADVGDIDQAEAVCAKFGVPKALAREISKRAGLLVTDDEVYGGSETEADGGPMGALASVVADAGKVTMDAFKEAVKEAFDLKKLHASRLKSVLSEGADAGLWDYSASEVQSLELPPPGDPNEPNAKPEPAPKPELDTRNMADEKAPAKHLFIGCMPEDGRAASVDDVLAEVYERVAKANDVADYQLMDYGNGPKNVFALARGTDAAGDIWSPAGHPMTQYLTKIFPNHRVVRGVR